MGSGMCGAGVGEDMKKVPNNEDAREAAGGRWMRKNGRKNGQHVWVPGEPLQLNIASENIIRKEIRSMGRYPQVSAGTPANLLRKQGYINALRWVLKAAGLKP